MSKLPQQARLILPDDPGRGITRARFDELLSDAKFAKLDTRLETLLSPALFARPENRQALRDALRFHCWNYYKACLPKAKTRNTKGTLKQEAARSTEAAEELANSIDWLWRSGDPAVRNTLSDLANVWPPRDSIPSAPLTPGLVRLLEQLTRRLELLASTLPDDKGGRTPLAQFDEFLVALAGMFVQLTKWRQLAEKFPQGTNDFVALIAHGEPPGEPATASTRGEFFRFVADVVDMLRSVEHRLPAARLNLPSDDDALRKRLAKKAIPHAVKRLAEGEAPDRAELAPKNRRGKNPG